MPNLKQQKRRVEITARQRLENVRYRSTAKTIFRRLEQAVADGDKTRAAEEHRELVRLLDRGGAREASQPNKKTRKKSQAERLLAGRS
jgi:small subunit ribosomal protein S20